MKSYVAKPLEIERKWYVVDADGKTLGRLASEVAKILRGKHKPIYTPHVDTGDFVIIVNAEKVRLTGKKLDQKMFRWHTGYIGHLKERTYRDMLQNKPETVVEAAIKGMLPHNSLGSAMYTKLKVYAGPEHKHEAQKPEVLELNL
ncbi:50S ribosomal protein L13 [Fusibacter ferrireducens]|uniref:Large ribosomal subunit protein uL13 n=1 Tax=Fusibacter ferrireducens TaxID=2785058 RepID=A0ABR9ZZC9_9FIRM|nr:50S ribosomal protein L13 [Fusibacter ferrireducens]MBF4695813.1 50S ribosomal protein L13 [Fusibacter ferrireducens]